MADVRDDMLEDARMLLELPVSSPPATVNEERPLFLDFTSEEKDQKVDPPRRSTQFSCTSFKDIQDLLSEDSSLVPYSPRRQILHQPRSPGFHGYPSRPDFLPPTLFSAVDIPNADNRDVVIYFTSLRVAWETFKECRTIKAFLHGFRIPIDERDLSMDSRFQDELKTIFGTKNVGLPQVFIGGKYIGGGEEIKQLQERGELKKIMLEHRMLLEPPVSSPPATVNEERSLFLDFTSEELDQKVDPLEKERYRKQAMESCGFYFDDDVIHPFFGIFPTECTSDRDHMGKIGLHCYNIEKGTNLQFKRLLKCYAALTDFTDFFLTLEAMDPVDNSVHIFETRVWYVGWENGATLTLRTIICRIKPQVAGLGDAELLWDFDAIDKFYKGDIPGWLPDDALSGSDKLQFYELTEPEIKENGWLKLYAESAMFSLWLCDTRIFAPIEMKKIVVQTKEDVVSSMKVKSSNAIFYLNFKASGVEDMKAIVRKTMDGRTGHFSLETELLYEQVCWA